ncbi:MAG: PDZ domain-containing protein [Chloroflexi bacterium]|nr:MAG: PDZ domain-containing protein [Chloroflexota bacterium]
MAASLKDFSTELASAVDRASQSVVRINARRGRAGSGIVWGDNLIVTADHVVENDDEIQVTAGEKTVKATVVGRDPGSDLAVLRAEGLSAPAFPRGSSADLKIGNLVLAIGRPNGLQATMGMVSSLGSAWRNWRGGDLDRVIQSDTTLYPGFSGGPLVDAEGRVVGLNSWHYGRGISVSIPIEAATRIVDSLKTHGRIKRPYLGIGTQPVRLADPAKTKVNQEGGLLVLSVEPDSGAGKGGVLQGDIIVALADKPTPHLNELFNALRQLEVGSTQTLRIVRAGETRDLKVTVGERGVQPA